MYISGGNMQHWCHTMHLGHRRGVVYLTVLFSINRDREPNPNWCKTRGSQLPSSNEKWKLKVLKGRKQKKWEVGFMKRITLGFRLLTLRASHSLHYWFHTSISRTQGSWNLNLKFLIHSFFTNKRSLEPIYRLYKSPVPRYNRCTRNTIKENN